MESCASDSLAMGIGSYLAFIVIKVFSSRKLAGWKLVCSAYPCVACPFCAMGFTPPHSTVGERELRQKFCFLSCESHPDKEDDEDSMSPHQTSERNVCPRLRADSRSAWRQPDFTAYSRNFRTRWQPNLSDFVSVRSGTSAEGLPTICASSSKNADVFFVNRGADIGPRAAEIGPNVGHLPSQTPLPEAMKTNEMVLISVHRKGFIRKGVTLQPQQVTLSRKGETVMPLSKGGMWGLNAPHALGVHFAEMGFNIQGCSDGGSRNAWGKDQLRKASDGLRVCAPASACQPEREPPAQLDRFRGSQLDG